MRFSETLKKLMKCEKMSQSDLIRITGIDPCSVRKWLNGKSYPHMKTILRLCESFNVTPNVLLGFDDFPAEREIPDLDELQNKIDSLMNDLEEICDTIAYTQKLINKLRGE